MLSQTVEYALRAMMHLARLDGAPVNCQTIAAETRVPQGYLSKVMRDLVVAGLVASFRGPNGGFILAKPPEGITILDVVNAVDPIMRIHKCPMGNPQHTSLCSLHQRLDDALAKIERTFRDATLAEMLADDGTEGRCTARVPNAKPAPGSRGED